MINLKYEFLKKSNRKNTLLGLLSIVLIYTLKISYTFFPDSSTLNVWGYSFQIKYYYDWYTFVWTLSTILLPLFVVSALLLTNGKNQRPSFYIITIPVLFFMVFEAWEAFDDTGFMNPYIHYWHLLVSITIISVIYFYRNYNRDPYSELMTLKIKYAIQQGMIDEFKKTIKEIKNDYSNIPFIIEAKVDMLYRIIDKLELKNDQKEAVKIIVSKQLRDLKIPEAHGKLKTFTNDKSP